MELVPEGGKGRGDEPDGEGSLLNLILQGVMRDYHGRGRDIMERFQCDDFPERTLEEAENRMNGRCAERRIPGEWSEW